jgi:hypothetical protein
MAYAHAQFRASAIEVQYFQACRGLFAADGAAH